MDAPVSGGEVGARNATLTIMAGATGTWDHSALVTALETLGNHKVAS